MFARLRTRFSELVLDNPVFLRAAVPGGLRGVGRKAVGRILAVALVLSAVLGLYVRARTDAQGAGLIALVGAWAWAGLTVIIAALEASRSIGYERLQGTWDMLVLTRLGRGAIVVGKLFGPLVPLWAVGLLLLPFCLVLLYGCPEPIWPEVFVGAYSAAVIGGTAAASLGLFFSMVFRAIFSAQLATVIGGWVAVGILPGIVVMPGLLLAWEWGGLVYALLHGGVALTPGALALALLVLRFDQLDRRFRQGRA